MGSNQNCVSAKFCGHRPLFNLFASMFGGEFDPLNMKLSTSLNYFISCYICMFRGDFDTLIATNSLTEPALAERWFSLTPNHIRAMNFSYSVPKLESLHSFGNGLKRSISGTFQRESRTGCLYNLLFSSPNIMRWLNWLVHITHQSKLRLKKIYSEEKFNI